MFWLRWSLRDLRKRWLLVVAIALVIAIGTGLYTGIGSLETWRRDSNDASFSLLHAHDLKVTLAEGSQVRAGEMRSALRQAAPGEIEAAQERLSFPTQVDASRGGRSILTPGRIIGMDVKAKPPLVDGIAAEAGRQLRASDSGRPVAIVEQNFAKFYELPARGTVRIAGGSALHYVGHGSSPEYFLVTRPGGGDFGAAEASYGVLFVPLATAQRLAGQPGAVNELVLRLRTGVDPAAVAPRLKRALRTALPRIGFQVTSIADEPAYRVLYRDAEGDQRTFNVFAYLILAGAALAAFNLASRIVESERREIGIGMALGVPPAQLAIRPLLLGAEIALGGALFGVGLGLIMGGAFSGALRDLLPLPVIETPFEPGVFIRGAALGFLLPLLATAIPVWRAMRVKPVEAIRVGFRSTKGGGLAPLLKRVRIPGRSLAQMPVRNFARAPRRTLMTVLGIGAVVTVLVGLLGTIDSYLDTADRSAAEARGESRDRLIVELDRFRSLRSAPLRRIGRAEAVGADAPRLLLPGALAKGNRAFDVSLALIDAESAVWRPSAVEGELRGGRPGVMISEKAAEDLGVTVGDTVALTHPRRTGPSSFAFVRTQVPVAGLDPDPFRTFAYMDYSRARAMGLEGQANGLDVVPAAGFSQDDVKRALFGVRGVASVEAATTGTDLLRDRLDEFVGVLRVIEVFALLLALLIAFNSTAISLDERARENATLFAFGVPVRTVLGISVAESALAGVLGTLVGIVGGVAVIGWIVSVVAADTFPDLGVNVAIGAGTLVTAVVVGMFAVALAPLLTGRRLRRMDLSSTLRVVE